MGAEPFRGGDVLAEAHERLAKTPGITFVGNVASSDIAKGRADVIVCEGLLGSVVLAFLEGITEIVTDIAGTSEKQSWFSRLGMRLWSRGVAAAARIVDDPAYGGAPLLGFEQLLLKVHERARARAIANAIKLAAKATRDGVAGEIAAAVQALR